MELPPNSETTGLGSTGPVHDLQVARPLGGHESGSQDAWIHRPSPSITRQPPAFPVNTYQLDLPDMTIQRLPVVHPTSYLRTRLDHTVDPDSQEIRSARASVSTNLPTRQDHTIAADGQGSRSPRASANPNEPSGEGVSLGLGNRGDADSGAAIQHHPSQSRETSSVTASANTSEQSGGDAPLEIIDRGRAASRSSAENRPRQRRRTPIVRVSVGTVQARGRGNPRAFSHRGHADRGAATQRQAPHSHAYERANISRRVTRGIRYRREPRIPPNREVLVREGSVEEMIQFVSGGFVEGGQRLFITLLRREGWVISSITFHLEESRASRARIVYYRTVQN